jgi:tripartite-type tricarboxylate transporter receptor subunit TctC
MEDNTMKSRFLLATIACLVALAAPGYATDFPNRPIRIVVPFAAGGGVDSFARMIADRLNTKFGTPVIVENRAGANGTLGGSTVLQAQPDGYTLLFSANTHVMAKEVMAKAPYDPLTAFTPIARVGQAPLLAVISPGLPQKTLLEVAQAAKEKPESWTAATAALGSPGHIAEIAFNQITKGSMVITPYRGTAPALTDVAGGHVQMLVDAMVVLLPMVKSGNVKAVAITASRRSSLAPEVPTAAESGVPGLEVYSWYGLWGPKSMPADLVTTLHNAATEAAKELEASGKLKEFGIELVNETSVEFATYAENEVKRNAALLKAAGFQPQ